MLSALLYSPNSTHRASTTKSVIWGLVELFAFSTLMRFCFTKQVEFAVFCLFLYANIYLFIERKGFLSNWLSKKIWSDLAVYCYSIYMLQEAMWPLLNKFLWTNAHFGMHNFPKTVFLVSNVIIIAVGVATYYLVEKPAYRFKNK